jgi:hypothetical protein
MVTLRGRSAILGRVALVGAAMAVSLCAEGLASSAAAVPRPPNPDLAHYVPATDEVTSERSIQLTTKGPPQVVVTDENAQANSQGSSSRDLLIFLGPLRQEVGDRL